jgi:hypothetical protein
VSQTADREARSRPAAGIDPRTEGLVRLEDAYLSLTKGLPEYSGLSERTLRGLLKHPAHPLPCYRIGGKILVRRSEYDSWTQQFRAVSPSCVDAIVADVLREL